ncbi:mucin-associated surface protein [Streptomyces blattellae]|uniref:ABC transporter substrate-binding protein n=1 Tax=Streptomyces blattellae TaxID=2569855 RepID=UPI0012B8C809|nr:ABC transporter substrate-binding protein [Streptomyces blattellae]
MNSPTIGTALIGGYVLGRKKKAKVALGLALAMAARRAKASDLAGSFSPVFGNLNRRVRTELAGAGKAAAGSVLSAQADHLADALHQRTLDLQEKTGKEEPPEDEGRDDRDEAAHDKDEEEDAYDVDEGGDDEAGHEEEAREDARKPSRRSASRAEPTGETRRKTSGPGRRTRRSDDG